jgi:hypothetical protein
MRVHDRRTRGDLGRFDLEHGHRAWLIPALRGVHEYEQVAPVEQFIDKVDAPDAEVGDLDAVRQRTLREQPDHFDAEGVVALEDVADPGDQRPSRHGHGSTSSGAKYRNRPCADRRSASGSSASVTAR